MDVILTANKQLIMSIIHFLRRAYKKFPAEKKEQFVISRGKLIDLYELDYNENNLNLPHAPLKVVFAHYMHRDLAEIELMYRVILIHIVNFLQQESNQSSGDRVLMIYTAINCLKDVCAAEPDDYEAVVNLSTIYKLYLSDQFNQVGNDSLSAGRYKDCVIKFGHAITLDPENTGYLVNRALSHMLLRDYPAAIADSKEALDVDPTCIAAYNHLGTAYLRQGMLQEAHEAFEEALMLEPDDLVMQEKVRLITNKLIKEQNTDGFPIPPTRKCKSDTSLQTLAAASATEKRRKSE